MVVGGSTVVVGMPGAVYTAVATGGDRAARVRLATDSLTIVLGGHLRESLSPGPRPRPCRLLSAAEVAQAGGVAPRQVTVSRSASGAVNPACFYIGLPRTRVDLEVLTAGTRIDVVVGVREEDGARVEDVVGPGGRVGHLLTDVTSTTAATAATAATVVTRTATAVLVLSVDAGKADRSARLARALVTAL